MVVAEELELNADVDAVIPFFEELNHGDCTEALKSIKSLADGGNLFASYVLGSYFIFGATPRFYDFNQTYEAGEVKLRARIETNETFGLSYLLRLLKIKEGNIPLYQLEGIWDLYKIISGDSAFFVDNDIECRPIDGSGQLGPLFKNGPSIKNLLVKLDHHEIYLDEAKALISKFNESSDNDLLDKALSYLEAILNEREIYKFSMYDIKHANLILARLYANGLGNINANLPEAIKHYEAARLDQGYLELIEILKPKGEKYKKFIKKYIGLINNRELKNSLYEQNDFAVPLIPDVAEALRKLVKTKPSSKSEVNFTLDFDHSQSYQELAEEFPNRNNVTEFVEKQLSEEEEQKVLERVRKEAEAEPEDITLDDNLDGVDNSSMDTDEVPVENDNDLDNDLSEEFSFVDEYSELDFEDD